LKGRLGEIRSSRIPTAAHPDRIGSRFVFLFFLFWYNTTMDEETAQKLADMDKKLDNIYRSAEKTRKYFLWTMIISLVVFVLPLVALLFVVPFVFSVYSGVGGEGGDINQTLDRLGL